MGQNKENQEPFIINTTGGEDNKQNKDIGAAVGILNKAIIIGVGNIKASLKILSENFSKLAGDKKSVHIMDVTSGKEYEKDENGKDVAPERKMTGEVRNKAAGIINKMKDRILEGFTSVQKKVVMGAVIALATASLFAGGLGNDAKTTLQNNYSTLNPRFTDSYETLVEYNGGNKGLAGNYMADFLVEVFKEEVENYGKQKGGLPADAQEIAFTLASNSTDVVKTDLYARDGSQYLEITVDEGAVKDRTEGFIAVLEEYKEAEQEKVADRLPSGGPDPNILSTFNGRLNSDGSATFEYTGASNLQAKTRADNLFTEYINSLVKDGKSKDAKTLSALTDAKNHVKTVQNSDGSYTSTIVLPKELVKTLGYTSGAEKTKAADAGKVDVGRGGR